MIPLLHLPLDFERREDVRRFRRACGGDKMAVTWALRMWFDWGTAGIEWRVISAASEQVDWAAEDVTYIIEEFCGFIPIDESAPAGGLIEAALSAGLLILERRAEKLGLLLNDFWRFNSHLSPSHKTIQQKGAEAKHRNRKLAEVDQLADQQVRLLAEQGQLVFQIKDATPEETKQSIAVVMRLDRSCGLPIRRTSDYVEQKALMASALRVVRQFKEEEVSRVCEYIIANRENPRLVKLPDRILEKFGELLGKASEHGS